MALSPYLRWFNLRTAFRRVFETGDVRDEYGDLTLHARRVFAGLREFCHANDSCVVVAKDGRIDTHATAVAEGRREVLLWIQHHMNLSDDVLMKLKTIDDE